MLTHLKLITDKLIQNEEGTGRFNGEEVYPTTPTLLKQLGYSSEIITRLRKKQKEKYIYDFKETVLRPYQQDDVLFLSARHTAGCFNEQRTGKTPTICHTIKMLSVTKVLIVCPASMVLVWAEEYKRWTGMECSAFVGTAKQKEQILKNWKYGLAISYESLRETSKGGMIKHILEHTDIQCVIADEAHRISNHKSKQAQALFKLKHVPWRYALTGTPAPNKSEQIFSILHFLHPDIFTGYWRFINYYYMQCEQYVGRGKIINKVEGFKPGKEIELQEFLNAISTQRKRKEVMEWLPDKSYTTVHLPINRQQTKYLKELHEDYETEEVIAVNVLDRLIKERQLCLSPSLLGLAGNSPKLEWIRQYLSDYPDKTILIFSKFTSWLKLLSIELNAEMIIGETKLTKRKQLCAQIQDKSRQILLINIDAGKEGLTLDGADVAIFTDRFPPVGALAQAEDRFVATTKDKAEKEHTVITLIMRDTYEEVIEQGISENIKETDLINNYKLYLAECGAT